ncbi:2Fe-2S iron-sulfur cluster-binding protein [Methanobrevibacter sp. DSM 116169]|uniref:2Fe-2S iron-sulfur cluster-binding protein n=1 Tax=Methanobrevibacter sp. DSM 116169 TaxID=3242727 RepID=UPI0038FCEC08
MRKINIKIKRFDSDKKDSYFQTFVYEGNVSNSIAFVLEELNSKEELIDIDGNKAKRIEWECGCLQKKCGACSMVINNKPNIACSSILKDLLEKNNTIIIEPLSKFQVIADLKVNKEIIFNNLKNMNLWLESDAKINENQSETEYQSSRCLMCGCCLEICPNFNINNSFNGTLSMVNAFKLINQEENSQHKKEMIKEYRKHFYNGCGKSLSCNDICPINLPIEELITKSNAISIWNKSLK